VRRALDAGIEETTIVLRRVGAILAEIEARDSVTASELSELGKRHAFHSARLWDTFRARDPSGFNTPYVPPLQRQGRSRFELSPQGRELLRVWRRSETIDDRLEGVLLDIQNVSFVDSSFLGAVILCAQRLAERGTELKVRNPSHQARRVFETTNLTHLLE